MYVFEAHYINMETDDNISRTIKIEGQFFETEREIFLYAMNKAYNMIGTNEMFSSLDFIAC